jgi:hypothetical protein
MSAAFGLLLVGGWACRRRGRVTRAVGQSAATVSHVSPRVYKESGALVDQLRSISEVAVRVFEVG